jgi:hypothetical protein
VTATVLRLAGAGVLSWYFVFLCEHATHHLVHAPGASRWPLWSRLRRIHLRHHRRYAGPSLLSPVPYRSEGGAWLALPSLPLLAALWWALPSGVFTPFLCLSALFLLASDRLHAEMHTAGSPLERFAWFQRRRRYHFEHHRHPRTNLSLGGMELLFDRLHGTWRGP